MLIHDCFRPPLQGGPATLSQTTLAKLESVRDKPDSPEKDIVVSQRAFEDGETEG